MNKIGLHIGYWWGTSAASSLMGMLELTHSAALDVIEITPAWLLKLSDSECRDFLSQTKDYGMTITLNGGLDQTNDISSDSEEIRKAGVQYCTDVLNRMPALEIGLWSGVNYSAWLRKPLASSDMAKEKSRARELSLDSMRRIIKVAESVHVDYCFEVVNRYEQFIFNTAKDAVAFAEEVGSPNAKVHLDTFHMNIEEDNMYAAIAYAGVSGRLGHVHTGESNRRIPGVGAHNIDWNLIAKALNSVSYRGVIVMEPFVLTAAHNAKRTHVWRDLGPSDSLEKLVEDAREGGRFIRAMMANNQ